MNVESVLDRILIKDSGATFYRFSNSDGKVWLMPVRNMRIAMNLYQPSGRNGKAMKALFPWLHRVPLVRKAAHAQKARYALNEELRQLLVRIFQEPDLEFSVFCGTPSVHRKITMQISCGSRILGYCKATESEEIAALFRGEAEMLNDLHRKGIQDVPECLFCGDTDRKVTLFVQSTAKTSRSLVLHEWTELHTAFLENLYARTRERMPFEQSDYYRTLNELLEHEEWLPAADRPLIGRIVREVLSRFRGRQVDFSAYHADFTPWNMFGQDSRLFVFDWEYARRSYPPMLDRYHFFLQTALFEKGWQLDDIAAYLRSEEGRWADPEALTLYLLDMIARFTIREKGRITGDIAHSMEIWTGILKNLQI